SEELKETYERYAMHTHGAVLRDELAWNEYWLWDSDDVMAAVYYNEKNEPDGYVIYWIANDVFHIKDMIFNNEDARTGLWNFVSAHFSMIDRVEGDTYTDEPLAFLLEDASIKEVISPYFMGRIVDFEAFVEEYPFRPSVLDREWKFTLMDPVMECNQGSFLLTISRDGHGEAKRIMEPCRDRISIQTMTTMLMGYKRPEYLAKIGRIQASEWTIDMLEDAIEQQTPYISDYF
ncbi:MAG TPA: sterol carrier protein domain-containing protein, partial [Candidatus Blautia excrementigallinarum]|nr:sterol carrier protein domain-containing protein [Candidatus Blautia excrementigallinarum]